jgi:hypothetical protein
VTDTQAPEKGSLIGFYNLKKEPGDDRPAFQGRLSLPGNPVERPFALPPRSRGAALSRAEPPIGSRPFGLPSLSRSAPETNVDLCRQ